MSRSDYIYIVQNDAHEHGDVVAAFTVKHEMVTWLKCIAKTGQRPWFAIRVRDGEPDARIADLDIAELLSSD